MPNRLADETSPYLQQHMNNPVDWFPWGEEALAKARAEDKPLLVSIGYSSCHWCHVMAHESFEDEETAALMNDRFVNVKVDREERPDLDSVYMTAVQAMTGHGGWPLNVFLTPEGVPFYGGTYWPPAPRQGMPSFRQVLEAVSDAYQNRRAGVEESAEKIRDYLERATRARPQEGDLDAGILDAAFHELSRAFDAEYGGFGGAPKFPQPAVLDFLLRYAKRSGDERASAMVRVTLGHMAEGGIYDQISGGFARYSVDAEWLVPHFEKMLYDNAQLARVYLDAHRADANPLYARVATETLDYVVREMTGPDGGFYSSQDADSEGVEGKFYVWTPAEINAALPPREAALVRAYYGVTKRGPFEGKNILHVATPLARAAAKAGIPEGDARLALDDARAKLLAARNERAHPGRDEKVLTSWNGLMLRAFAEASRVLGRGDYRDVAERNADFLLTHLRQGDRLLHSYRNGQAKIPGFLEDYADLASGLLALYEATFERRWIEATLELVQTMIAGFADPDGPGFYDTAAGEATPVGRPRDLQDGATPSGNSVAAGLVLKLAAMTGNADYHERAAAILRMMARPMGEQPLGFGQYLCDLDFYLAMPKEVAIAGHRGDPAVAALADVVYRRFEPHAVLGLADPDDPTLGELLPFLAHRPMKGGVATAYVCEHFACLPPVTDPEDLAIQLEQGTGIVWQEV